MTEVRLGIHLPQAGPAASPDSIKRAAELAETLGYRDVWVSDHLIVPEGAKYPPSPYIFEPIVALTWAAAATSRVRLGTTILVMPLRNPVFVAKALASLDQCSEGRVILGTAAGWLEKEFDAVGVPFVERGPRTDEAIEILRQLWTQDPVTASYPVHGLRLDQMRAKPQPKGHVPIWIGGHGSAAVERAIRVGDGWHGAFGAPEEIRSLVERLKEARPEHDFTISMRTRWDALEDERDVIMREFEGYQQLGVTHIVPEPRQRSASAYLESIEALAALLAQAGARLAID